MRVAESEGDFLSRFATTQTFFTSCMQTFILRTQKLAWGIVIIYHDQCTLIIWYMKQAESDQTKDFLTFFRKDLFFLLRLLSPLRSTTKQRFAVQPWEKLRRSLQCMQCNDWGMSWWPCSGLFFNQKCMVFWSAETLWPTCLGDLHCFEVFVRNFTFWRKQ